MLPYRKKMQIVFQDPYASLNPRMTVGDIVGEPIDIHKLAANSAERKEMILESLRRVGLNSDHAGRYPHEVSGGQCQRAAIARALAIRPKVLICDEATSALDVTVQQQIMELLAALRKSGDMSYLFICHNLALVQNFCDRLLVMYEGKIVEEGTPDEVIFHPESDYTRLLIDSIL